MSSGLYQRYRPTELSEVLGQPEAVKVLEAKLQRGDVPHAILFVGPSGVGKTTLARIVKDKLGCGELDFIEVNCANSNGIDLVRDTEKVLGYAPASGKCRVWILDEFQQMTKAAQNGFLKLLEDMPNHVYFMLASTDPAKIIRAVQTRCTVIQVKSLSEQLIRKLVKQTANLECPAGWSMPDEVLDKIAELAEGSARKALVMLESIIGVEPDDQLDTLQKLDGQKQIIDLCRALLNPRSKWPEIAAILKQMDDEPESIRRAVLGYATKVILSGGKLADRAYLIAQAFRDDTYSSGLAGIVLSAKEVFLQKD